MSKYELPAEPPVGTRLVNEYGEVYHLAINGKWYSSESHGIDWHELLMYRYELEEYSEPDPVEGEVYIKYENFDNFAMLKFYADGKWNYFSLERNTGYDDYLYEAVRLKNFDFEEKDEWIKLNDL